MNPFHFKYHRFFCVVRQEKKKTIQINRLNVERGSQIFGKTGSEGETVISPQGETNVNTTKVNMVQHGEVNTGLFDWRPQQRMTLKKKAARKVYNSYLRAANWRTEMLDVNKGARGGDSSGWTHPPKKKKKEGCPTAFRNPIRQFLPHWIIGWEQWPHFCF